MEFGGKLVNIVCEDVDFDVVVEGVVMLMVLNKGEVCFVGLCLFVYEKVCDDFFDKFQCIFVGIWIGDLMLLDMQFGFQVLWMQMDKIFGYLEEGLCEGVWVLMGGGCVCVFGYDNGFFI